MIVLGAVLLTIGILTGGIGFVAAIFLDPIELLPIAGALLLVDAVSLCVAALVLFNLAGIG